MRGTSLGLLGILGLFLSGCGQTPPPTYQVTYTPAFQTSVTSAVSDETGATPTVVEKIEIDSKALEKASATLGGPLQGYFDNYTKAAELVSSGNLDAQAREKLLKICVEIQTHANGIAESMEPVLTAVGVKPGSELRIVGNGERIELHGEPKEITLYLKIKTNGGKVAGFELSAVREKDSAKL